MNQWFTESQFESYRTLGAHAIAMIADKRDGSGKMTQLRIIGDLLEFGARAEAYLKGYQEQLNQQARMRA